MAGRQLSLHRPLRTVLGPIAWGSFCFRCSAHFRQAVSNWTISSRLKSSNRASSGCSRIVSTNRFSLRFQQYVQPHHGKAHDGRSARQEIRKFQESPADLAGRMEEHSDLGQMPTIFLPGEEHENDDETDAGADAKEEPQKFDCRTSIAAARTRLQEIQTGMSAAMETVLGHRIELTTRQEVDAFIRTLDEAADLLKGSALRELPSVVLLGNLGKVTERGTESGDRDQRTRAVVVATTRR